LTSPLRISLQILTPAHRDFFGNSDHEQSHQVPVLIGYPNPAFFGLPHPLWEQRVHCQ
jgi:hypothetical protein